MHFHFFLLDWFYFLSRLRLYFLLLLPALRFFYFLSEVYLCLVLDLPRDKHFENPVLQKHRQYVLEVVPRVNRFAVYTSNEHLFVLHVDTLLLFDKWRLS